LSRGRSAPGKTSSRHQRCVRTLLERETGHADSRVEWLRSRGLAPL